MVPENHGSASSSEASVNQPPGRNGAGPSNPGPREINNPWASFPSVPSDLPPLTAGSVPSVPSVPSVEDEVIGGDSVLSIQQLLLSNKTAPSAHEIYMARINAEDLFEVKVEIIQLMAGLDPTGNWMGRGARALDNPRTATGEESLERLRAFLDDLNQGGEGSETFSQLKERVPRQRAGDEHSTA